MDKALQVIDQREVLGKQFTIYGNFERPLFLAGSVAACIEHSDVSAMLENVDRDEKIKFTTPSDYFSEGLQSKCR